MTYQIAEKFKSIQGEGVYAGTPMAFIRFTGCSVGKRICQHCDTDFEKPLPWLGGGEFTIEELLSWSYPHEHVCLTGGEPFDQNLGELVSKLYSYGRTVHVETSGTRFPPFTPFDGLHMCVSPKPGFLEEVVMEADEIKVIVPGLGNGEGWPDLQDALRWANAGKTVFLQPRNGKYDINNLNLSLCQELIAQHPNLRLSVQTHKLLRVR